MCGRMVQCPQQLAVRVDVKRVEKFGDVLSNGQTKSKVKRTWPLRVP